jgi:hypothetical protein
MIEGSNNANQAQVSLSYTSVWLDRGLSELEHDPEKCEPVFHGERIRSPQIMLKQKAGIMMRFFLIAS